MTSTCPSCGLEASGRFCSHCGANLEGPVTCAECNNPLPPGGRFCNQCGTPTPATRATLAQPEPTRPARSLVPWAVAGVTALALAGVLLFRGGGDRGEQSETPTAPFATGTAGQGTGDPRAVDLASMTPREAADRLFERVMRLSESGDSAQARAFLPMALGAYQRVEELDADARYHLGVLHLFAGDAHAARAQADTVLSSDPDHLFGLYIAGRAEQALGENGQARGFFQRFEDRYDAEVAKARPEYQAHEPALKIMRQDASRAVDSP